MNERHIREIQSPPEIPDFRLLQKCGTGGFSEVWVGVDADGVRRAIRILSRDGQHNDDRWKKKDKEGCCLYRNHAGSHKNLLEILYHGEWAGNSYYISKLADNVSSIPGQYVPDTLARRLERKRFAAEDIFPDILALCEAVEYLHKRGLAHHDLKPENVVFVDKMLKLTDPGLMRNCSEVFSFGTNEFMPGKPCSGKVCDIFALGKILYCLNTGNSVRSFPELPRTVPHSCFWKLNRIVLKCCGGDLPEYQNVSEMKTELEKLYKSFMRRRKFHFLGTLCIDPIRRLFREG